jgi:hypothetical protein
MSIIKTLSIFIIYWYVQAIMEDTMPLFPKPVIMKIDRHQEIDDKFIQAARVVLNKGNSSSAVAQYLNITLDEATALISSDIVQSIIDESSRKPETILPSHASLYANVVEIAKNPNCTARDRLQATKMLLEIMGPPDTSHSLNDLAMVKTQRAG